MGSPEAYIGVDVGGTHTDVSVALDGQVFRGKALTDYEDFGRGVVGAIQVAAEAASVPLQDLLARTQLLINGTTVVTNAITELRGARVGVLVTAGFKDTFRFAGGPRLSEFDDHLQTNVPDLVLRHDLEEIEERIDFEGTILAPLDQQKVADATRRLIEAGTSAIAVCFLSSYANPAHELQAEAAIRSVAPDLFVSLSHSIFPVRGENRRWTTAVLNAFVHERARAYVESLGRQLREAGLSGGLAFFQGIGGGISDTKVTENPLALLGSGPAAGAIGANELARQMGQKRVLLGDMGGTSFDTGIINDNEIHIAKNLELGQFKTGVNLVDVVSIGAGGGSIAWIDERGVPRVGPRSATSHPGPAAYGLGGTEPTVTDAMVAMGFIDPERYLGGRFELTPQLAVDALERKLAEPLGWTLHQAAAAVHDLVVVNMATAVREVTVDKGYDPRDFSFLAYGGTLPLFAAQIAERLRIDTVVIPQNSSVFCALGLLAADYVRRYNRTIVWDLELPAEVERVNEVIDALSDGARRDMREEGFADENIEIRVSGDFRFRGQYYELTMLLPERRLSEEDAPVLARRFLELYEQTYGEGTAWKGVPEELLNISVTVVGKRRRQPIGMSAGADARTPDEILRDTRTVFLPDARESATVPIYDDSRFSIGSTVSGPAIIDASDTTIYVPGGVSAVRDEYRNYVLTREGEPR